MKNIIKKTAWVVSFQLIGAFIGWLMQNNVDGWYQALHRSALTPPDYVFGMVWPVLYFMLALVGYHIWNSLEASHDLQKIKAAYLIQMLLNWSWSIIFFNLRMWRSAVLVIGLMILITLFLLVKLFSKNRWVSMLLLPYAAWICFAFYLNFYTVKQNLAFFMYAS
jgi:benzodiazapine receptor